MHAGVVYAFCAYLVWGLLPVYWKALRTVPASEILCHRIVWSVVVVLLLIAGRRRPGWLRGATRPRALATHAAAAALLALNWLVYIWAVNAGYLVDASLGYYINPLINVALGRLVLGERLRPAQAVAISIAAVAVITLAASYGSVPWIALTLGFSFGLYGLLRKRSVLGPLDGFTLEVALMAVPALAFLTHLARRGGPVFPYGEPSIDVLLVLTGVATTLPMLWFAAAARRITLTTLGVIQYMTPTMQFLLGVLVYGEALTTGRLVTFIAIWSALAIYTIEARWQARRRSVARHAAS
jgi:chloramphenicol-sensitive protein RarD